MKKRAKILMIGPLPPPVTGQSIATSTLVDSRLKDICDIVVIDLSGRQKIRASGTFSFLRMLQLIRLICVAVWWHITWRPQITYLTIAQSLFGFFRDVAFINIAKLSKARCVIHLHGGYFGTFYEESNCVMQRVIRATLAKVDRAVVLADSLRNMFEGLVEADRIRVISNCVQDEMLPLGVEIEAQAHYLRERDGARPLAILFLSNFLKSKGYWDLLQATRMLKARGVNVAVNLAGAFPRGEEEEEVIAFLKQYGLEESVKLHGVVRGEEKRRLLLESDIFVLPSYYRWEGQPICILEAMSFGLPVITTEYRAIPSMITDGENGVFVSPKAPAAIADAIGKFRDTPELLYKMGKANREKVMMEFTEEQYIKNFISLFEEISKS